MADIANSVIREAVDFLGGYFEADNIWVKFAESLNLANVRSAVTVAIQQEANFRSKVDAACERFIEMGTFPDVDNVTLVLIHARLGWAHKMLLMELQRLGRSERQDATDLRELLQWTIITSWAASAVTAWPTKWIKEVQATIGPQR